MKYKYSFSLTVGSRRKYRSAKDWGWRIEVSLDRYIQRWAPSLLLRRHRLRSALGSVDFSRSDAMIQVSAKVTMYDGGTQALVAQWLPCATGKIGSPLPEPSTKSTKKKTTKILFFFFLLQQCLQAIIRVSEQIFHLNICSNSSPLEGVSMRAHDRLRSNHNMALPTSQAGFFIRWRSWYIQRAVT